MLNSPVYPTNPLAYSVSVGFLSVPTKKSPIAAKRIISKTTCAYNKYLPILIHKSNGSHFLYCWQCKDQYHTLASHSIPTTTIIRRIRMVTLPIMRTSCTPPSTILMLYDASNEFTDSQKPTTYIAHATAFARENINPIDPPNSGPSDLEIM